MSTITARPTATRLTQALLACGGLYAALYVAVNDVVAAGLYAGYDPVSQAVSELSATGSPARSLLTALSPLWTALMIAFGAGVLRAARGRRALRVTGVLLIAHGVVALLWLAFPMTSRSDAVLGGPVPGNDVGHLVMTGVTLAFILSQLGFSAAAFGWWFRLYAIVSATAVVVFGTLTGVQATRLATGEPTPWMGLFERAGIAPWLLWMVVLAVLLAGRRERTHGAEQTVPSPTSSGPTAPPTPT